MHKEIRTCVAFSSKFCQTAETGLRESGLETMKHPLRFERPLSLQHLNQLLTPFLCINIYFDARGVVCTSDPDFEMRGPHSGFSKANTKEILKVTILYQKWELLFKISQWMCIYF